tara:strand:+ start:1829 stop:3385 length:1557 start_codon:yes stop_codon:yes gene_type:complete
MARKKPIPRSARKEINRGTLRSRGSDETKNLSVGLMDIDGAIMFYFNNVIKPVVQENDESVKVPIMYSNPERWNTIQKNGYLIDNKKQLITPLIVFKRTSIEKDSDLGVDKLDPKDPKLFYTFQKKYSKENRYDNFAVQQGLNKTKELYTVAVPDYVTLQYEFIIWTSYTEQMNKIIEKIIFSEGSYWGEDGKFKFRTSIDNYTDASEFSVNSERIIKTNFTVTLKGYLIPEEFNNVVTTQKHLTPKRILVGDDVSVNLTDLVGDKGTSDVKISVSNVAAGGGGSLENPFNIVSGLGVTVDGAGQFDGSAQQTFTFNIGQDVGTDQTVQFANISSSNALHIGPTSFEISQRDDGKAQVNTDWVVLGDIIAQNFIVSSSTTHMTTSFSEGNTAFGDTIDDTHIFSGSVNITGSLTLNGSVIAAASDSDLYLRKQFVKKASSITVPSTASFTAVTASSPPGILNTTENDFVFFINGQYMEHDALTIQQAGSNLLLIVDTDSIGYDLEADDEIIASGKFDS